MVCSLLTHDQSFNESNLLVICCCLPTLRRFFRHVAPRIIGEYSDNLHRGIKNHTMRTWGSMSTGPKRQFDTLMNTVNDGEGKEHIPLEKRGLGKRLDPHDTRAGAKVIKME